MIGSAPGIIMLLMGFAVTDPNRKSCSRLISGVLFALLFGQAKSSKENTFAKVGIFQLANLRVVIPNNCLLVRKPARAETL